MQTDAAMRLLIISLIAVLLIELRGVFPNPHSTIITIPSQNRGLAAKSIVSGSMQVDVGDKVFMDEKRFPRGIEGEFYALYSRELTLQYIEAIRNDPNWNSNIGLRIYPVSRVIEFTLCGPDALVSKSTLERLMRSCESNLGEYLGPRYWIKLRRIDPIREL